MVEKGVYGEKGDLCEAVKRGTRWTMGGKSR